ncbi:MAG: acetyl-CoA C-acyltransferase [Bacteroidetes bacterium QS_3_64_15]|nr:MAG: acetyl-CoA C-acyltransferase [Bacteroidetes bacterium QS_3_64_15]
MRDVYIASAVRTPIGTLGGSLKDHSPVDLAAPVMRAALDRADVDGGGLDLYIFGNVLRAGQGQLVPRQAALQAGIPKSIDGYAVDMVCASSMMSIMNGATMIKAGEADLILAGGTESMSDAGYYLDSGARWGYTLSPGGERLQDIMQRDGLSDPDSGKVMGEQTERLCAEHGIEREALDEIAAQSQQRAAEAADEGRFDDEITPVEYEARSGTETLTTDEGIRPDTTADELSNLSPAFTKDGVLTAGNSSQISDGAAAVLLASADAVKAHGLTPLVQVHRGGWSARESWRFPEAPIPAVHNVLDATDTTLDDYDLFENNEAFAINNILFHRKLDVPYNRLNVHGGAIALGHPIGASGTRITVTLLHALDQHDGEMGMAAICHGTGGGVALAVERT